MTIPVLRRDRAVERDDSGNGRTWDTIDDIERLHRDLTRYLDAWRPLPRLPNEAFTPLADAEETSDAYVIEVELPGVKREDLEIQVAGRRVAVRGERKERERFGILRRRERTVGRFAYEVTLPGDVDDERVEAHLDEGVLTIRLPKPETERPRRIMIR